MLYIKRWTCIQIKLLLLLKYNIHNQKKFVISSESDEDQQLLNGQPKIILIICYHENKHAKNGLNQTQEQTPEISTKWSEFHLGEEIYTVRFIFSVRKTERKKVSRI
jgi:hypothetical protein